MAPSSRVVKCNSAADQPGATNGCKVNKTRMAKQGKVLESITSELYFSLADTYLRNTKAARRLLRCGHGPRLFRQLLGAKG
jgi:hypothetical protein